MSDALTRKLCLLLNVGELVGISLSRFVIHGKGLCVYVTSLAFLGPLDLGSQ